MSRRRTAGLLLAVVASVSCGAEGTAPDAAGAIARASFVETYIELRMAELTSTDGEPDREERDAILDDHGVTEAELLEFVEVHGRDVRFMVQVWNEVDQSLTDLRTQPDSLENP